MDDTNRTTPSADVQGVTPEHSAPLLRDEFARLVRGARQAAKRSGLKPFDVTVAVAKVRRTT